MPTKYKCVTLGNFKDLGIYPLYFPIEISSTSYLYNFLVKKRKSNTKVKLFDINWQVKGQTKITNYVPRTTSVVPPLYYDCFRFIIFSQAAKKTKEKYWNFWQKIIWVGKEEEVLLVPDLSSVWDFEVQLSTFLPFSLCQPTLPAAKQYITRLKWDHRTP